MRPEAEAAEVEHAEEQVFPGAGAVVFGLEVVQQVEQLADRPAVQYVRAALAAVGDVGTFQQVAQLGGLAVAGVDDGHF